MACLFCGGKTVRGAVFAQRGNAHWQSDDVKGWKRIIAAADADRVNVADSETFGEGRPAAYYCRACQKIILDLAEKWKAKD